MEKILVIDDDPAVCCALEFALGTEFDVLATTSASEGLHLFKTQEIAATILDLRLGSVDGIQLLREMRQISPKCVVIVLTAYGTIRSSVEAMKEGAFYYLTKPFDISELKALIEKGIEIYRLYAQLEAMSHELKKQHEFFGMIGRSKAMSNIVALVNRVKDIDTNVLITGESGTGKEVVARYIHYSGTRKSGPFQVINCAAIPENLLESELFGYEKGAFTGASCAYMGKLRAADGGTVFFDEIGEMPLSLQAKLLRFLQDKVVIPLGANKPHPVNARIIAATNKDLQRLVKEGRFREDLFYRLKVITIEIPPLRERKEDILPLVHHFVAKYAGLLNRPVRNVSPEAMRALLEYDFPGNVRELEHIVERAVALATGVEITLADLPSEIRRSGEASDFHVAGVEPIPVYVGEKLETIERRVILRTLQATGGKRKEAARLLGITDRTLRNKMRRYGAVAEKYSG